MLGRRNATSGELSIGNVALMNDELMGNRHASKEPSIPAPGFASAVGIGCAGACKKCCAAKA